jgi:hypothetical protein
MARRSIFFSPWALASNLLRLVRMGAAGNDDQYLRLWDARACHLLKKWGDTRNFYRLLHSDQMDKYLVEALTMPGGWNVSSLQGHLLSSERVVNDDVEKEAFTSKGHTVHFLSSLVTAFSDCVFHL